MFSPVRTLGLLGGVVLLALLCASNVHARCGDYIVYDAKQAPPVAPTCHGPECQQAPDKPIIPRPDTRWLLEEQACLDAVLANPEMPTHPHGTTTARYEARYPPPIYHPPRS